MKKLLATSVLSLSLALTGCGSGVSGTPLPMTEMAMSQFNDALRNYDIDAAFLPIYKHKDDPDKKLQLTIEAYKQLFEHAGYSLEATLVSVGEQLSGSEEEDKDYLIAARDGLGYLMSISLPISKLAKHADLDLSDYMHEDAAQAMHKIAAIR